MSKNPLALVLVALALLIGVWLAFDHEAPTAAPPALETTASEVPLDKAPDSPTELKLEPAMEPATEPIAETQPERTEIAPPAAPVREYATYTGEAGFTVEVRDALTGEAVAGAEVLAYSADGARANDAYWNLDTAGQLPDEVLASGLYYLTDEAGQAHLPFAGKYELLAALAGKRRGYTLTDPHPLAESGKPLVIAIDTPRTLTALVVDEAGMPVEGAFVGIANESKGEWRAYYGATTDATGRTQIHNANLLGRWGMNEKPTRVQVDNPGTEPSFEAFDRKAVPVEPVRLVVGRGVDVLVHLVDAFGLPADVPNARVSAQLGSPDSKSLRAEATEDGYLFRRQPIGAGGTLTFKGNSFLGWPDMTQDYVVPVQDQDRTDVDLQLTFDGLTVVGHLLDESGATTSASSIQLTTHTHHASGHFGARGPGPVQVESDGTFVARLAERDLISSGEAPSEVWLSFTCGTTDPRVGETPPLASTEVGTLVDAGDLVLRMPPVHFAGTVVDAAGEPIEGARIQATPNRQAQPTAQVAPLLRNLQPGLAQTDANGHFELRIDCPPFVFDLDVGKEGYSLPEVVTLDSGAEELRFVLTRGGNLKGSVSAANSGWLAALELVAPSASGVELPTRVATLQQPNAVGRTAQLRPQSLREGTPFGWAGLPPGTYRVLVTKGENPEPVLVVDDLVVVAGETLEDPRITNLNLSALMPSIEIEVFGPDGKPLSQAVRGRVGVISAMAIEQMASFNGSRTRLSVPSVPVDLAVMVSGYLRADLFGASGKVAVHLEAAPTLSFALPQDLVVPEGWELRIAAERKGALPWRSNGYVMGPADLGPDSTGEFTFRPLSLGEHTFLLGAVKPGDWMDPSTGLDVSAGLDFTQAADGKLQQLDVDQEDLDSLCSKP